MLPFLEVNVTKYAKEEVMCPQGKLQAVVAN